MLVGHLGEWVECIPGEMVEIRHGVADIPREEEDIRLLVVDIRPLVDIRHVVDILLLVEENLHRGTDLEKAAVREE